MAGLTVRKQGKGRGGEGFERRGTNSTSAEEDEWATSYDDKLGRSLADVRAICASTVRDNTEPIDDTGWRYRSSPVRCR